MENKEKYQAVIILTNRKDLPARKDDRNKEIYVPTHMVNGVFKGVNRAVVMIDNTPVVIGGVGDISHPVGLSMMDEKLSSTGIPLQYLGMTDEQIEEAKGKKVSLMIYPKTRNVQFIVHGRQKGQQKDWMASKDVPARELLPRQLYHDVEYLERGLNHPYETKDAIKGTLSRVNSVTSVELKNDKGEVTLVECARQGYPSKQPTRLVDMQRMVGKKVEITPATFGGMVIKCPEIKTGLGR